MTIERTIGQRVFDRSARQAFLDRAKSPPLESETTGDPFAIVRLPSSPNP